MANLLPNSCGWAPIAGKKFNSNGRFLMEINFTEIRGLAWGKSLNSKKVTRSTKKVEIYNFCKESQVLSPKLRSFQNELRDRVKTSGLSLDWYPNFVQKDSKIPLDRINTNQEIRLNMSNHSLLFLWRVNGENHWRRRIRTYA